MAVSAMFGVVVLVVVLTMFRSSIWFFWSGYMKGEVQGVSFYGRYIGTLSSHNRSNFRVVSPTEEMRGRVIQTRIERNKQNNT